MIPLVVLSIMGMIAPPVWANGCRVVKRVRVVRVPVVKRVIVNRFIPVLTPVYLSTYTPPAPAPLQAPAYTPPVETPRALPAPPPAPAYDAPAPRAAPAPAYDTPAPRAAPAPDNGYGNGQTRGAETPDVTDRIITALEKLEERIEGLEARKNRAPARSQEYDEEDDPPPVRKKAAPRQMPQEPEDPEDDPPPVKKALPKKSSTSSLRRAIQQRRAAASRQESRAPSAPLSTLQRVHGIILQSCSGCHSAEDGARRGKGFVLVRGGRVIELTPAIRRAIVAEVTGSTMPPRPTPPMNPADKALLIQALRS